MAKSRKNPANQNRLTALLNGNKFSVGIDVHKRSYHVSLWCEEHGLLDSWVQPATPDVLLSKLLPYRHNVARIVYEAGPTGFSLVRALRAAGLVADVIAPSKMLAMPGRETKTDRIDSKKLAMYAAKDLLTPVNVPTEEQEADRQILRSREQVIRRSRTIKQQIKSFLLTYGLDEPHGLANWTKASIESLRKLSLSKQLRFCLDVMLDDLIHEKAQLTRIMKEIRRLTGEKRHCKTMALLQTVPGVGILTAAVFKTELVKPERFNDAGQISRIIGLAPGIRESGDSRQQGNILRSGNSRIRTALVEAAWRWVSADIGAAKVYHRLVRNTGSAKKAIVAMARKLGIVLWKISVQQKEYVPKYV